MPASSERAPRAQVGAKAPEPEPDVWRGVAAPPSLHEQVADSSWQCSYVVLSGQHDGKRSEKGGTAFGCGFEADKSRWGKRSSEGMELRRRGRSTGASSSAPGAVATFAAWTPPERRRKRGKAEAKPRALLNVDSCMLLEDSLRSLATANSPFKARA